MLKGFDLLRADFGSKRSLYLSHKIVFKSNKATVFIKQRLLLINSSASYYTVIDENIKFMFIILENK